MEFGTSKFKVMLLKDIELSIKMLKGPRQTYSIMYDKNNEFCGYAQLMTMRLAVSVKQANKLYNCICFAVVCFLILIIEMSYSVKDVKIGSNINIILFLFKL